MPAALPFTNQISQGSSRQRINRVKSAQFGDGYSQEYPDGLNPNVDLWNVMWNPLGNADRATLMAALDTGVFDYLTWQPDGYASSCKWKVVKDSVTDTPASGDLYTIAAQLRQVF
jgi:phage-related protein